MTKLLIVDVQRDFCEGGSLACEGGHKVAEAIGDFLTDNAGRYDAVYASRDYHIGGMDNGGHFADDPDFLDSWPAHCVQGTEGAEYAFDTTHVDYHIVKGMGVPAYSVLEGVYADSGDRFLVEEGEDWDVVGIATDYCVLQTVGDMLEAGANVTVLTDFIVPVTPETGADALEAMWAAGARLS